MKLIKNIMGEHEILPDEILTKKTSIVRSVYVLAGVNIL